MLWMMLASALAAPLDRHEIKRDLANGTVTFTWHTEGERVVDAGPERPVIAFEKGRDTASCREWELRAPTEPRYREWATFLREMGKLAPEHPNATLGELPLRTGVGDCNATVKTDAGEILLLVVSNDECFGSAGCIHSSIGMSVSAANLESVATLFDEMATLAAKAGHREPIHVPTLDELREQDPQDSLVRPRTPAPAPTAEQVLRDRMRKDALRTLKSQTLYGLWGPSQIRAHLEKYGLKPEDPDVVEIIGTDWMAER